MWRLETVANLLTDLMNAASSGKRKLSDFLQDTSATMTSKYNGLLNDASNAEQYLYDKSDIYHSLKDAFKADRKSTRLNSSHT